MEMAGGARRDKWVGDTPGRDPESSDARAIAPVVANSDLVSDVVAKLNHICKAATFDFAMNVGRLIVDNFYSGDLDRWRQRGVKNVSFRKLAKHPALPMSATALYRSVAIYELCKRMGIETWKHVSTSHIRLVLPLPTQTQARLLRTTEDEGWPVTRLRDEIVALRRSKDSAVALHEPPGDARIDHIIRALEKCLEDADDLVAKTELSEHLPTDAAQACVAVVHRLRDACASLENRLNQRLLIVGGNQRGRAAHQRGRAAHTQPTRSER